MTAMLRTVVTHKFRLPAGLDQPGQLRACRELCRKFHRKTLVTTVIPALRTDYLACLSIHLRWQGINLRCFFSRSTGTRISPQVPMHTDLVEYEQAYR